MFSNSMLQKFLLKWSTFSQYDYPKTLRRYAQVAEALGVSGRNDEAKLKGLIKKIDDLKEYVGIKKTIKDYGVDENTSSIHLTK